jgi:RHS repeat-associated protein
MIAGTKATAGRQALGRRQPMSFSPALGRWLQQDPIGYAAGYNNFYSLVGNNPVDRVDPTGLITITEQLRDKLNSLWAKTKKSGKEAGGILIYQLAGEGKGWDIMNMVEGDESSILIDVEKAIKDLSPEQKKLFQGTVHTHPGNSAFSSVDIFHFMSGDEGDIAIVETEKFTYVLEADAAALKKAEKKPTQKELKMCWERAAVAAKQAQKDDTAASVDAVKATLKLIEDKTGVKIKFDVKSKK